MKVGKYTSFKTITTRDSQGFDTSNVSMYLKTVQKGLAKLEGWKILLFTYLQEGYSTGNRADLQKIISIT